MSTEKRICANCSAPESEHLIANFVDRGRIGAKVLICPSAVFVPRREDRRDDDLGPKLRSQMGSK